MIRTVFVIPALLLASPAWSGEAAVQPVAEASAVRERAIAIEGGRNFRDVGGYRTVDGRTVKWGVLYRSGSLGSLTSRGMQQVQQLGVTSIVDLRTTAERKRDMNNWLPASGLGYWTRDYGYSLGDAAAVFSNPSTLRAEKVRAMMFTAYRSMTYEQAPSYREFFARLTSPATGAIVVNCTAGKDRTGIATALVLTAIGVPYETVREDFLLSNGGLNMDTLLRDLSGPMAALPADVAAPLVGVEGEYLDTAFAQIRADHGSVEAYLEKELGVGPSEIAALKRRLLSS